MYQHIRSRRTGANPMIGRFVATRRSAKVLVSQHTFCAAVFELWQTRIARNICGYPPLKLTVRTWKWGPFGEGNSYWTPPFLWIQSDLHIFSVYIYNSVNIFVSILNIIYRYICICIWISKMSVINTKSWSLMCSIHFCIRIIQKYLLNFGVPSLPSLKLTARTWKWMVGRRSFPFWDGLYSRAFAVSFREGISLRCFFVKVLCVKAAVARRSNTWISLHG